MDNSAPLMLFNSLTRKLEPFVPVHDGEARVYSCGPTVYNFQHIGNMRAYIFADTLGRVLGYKGYKLTHVINITDVGHLTSDADAGDDKMEKAAAAQGKSAWDIARYYQQAFERDLARLNIRKPAHPRATEYVETMVGWARTIAPKHCYELESGLYFDTSTVPDYGRLARAATEAGEGRIESVEGKRNAADFAIWRKTPLGESRQMEWDSPWGRGAPGWHLECSVMSSALLGHPFDIHTGGIDHREIHHPNEIAQNQAHGCTADSGARIWMHNNFLIERRGKMSKSTGDFLVLQTLVDKGFHPLAYRLMCLQAHYRSELEFSWENLAAALTRLKRIVIAWEKIVATASSSTWAPASMSKLLSNHVGAFDSAVCDDLNTPRALTVFEELLHDREIRPEEKHDDLLKMDEVLGLELQTVNRSALRVRPVNAHISEADIEAELSRRLEARAQKDYAASDRIRDELAAKGVEVMDGDPLGWDWKLEI